ncbi:MAG: ABC transporter permease [Candidatus Eisenbacteria bacterium]|nr:ABC transporter permease [Candidatus Eisenbacteria bacterium]MCC7140839.1 ABC transporter permease [Candidatus Eisenbacteria bacterium]
MLRRALFLARWDLALMLRHRETLMWMFVMPLLFMYVIGSMMQSDDPATNKPRLTVLDLDKGPVAKGLIAHLESLDYEVRLAPNEEVLGQGRRQLTISHGFSESVLAAQPETLRFRRGERSDLGGRLDEVRLNRALFSLLGDAVLLAPADTGASLAERSVAFKEGFSALRAKPPAITIDSRSAGVRRIIPSGFQQAVPGVMIQFILMVMLTTGGTFLVIDRDEGLLRRLASSPYHRGEIVAGKILSRLVIGVVQAAFALAAGTVLFHLDWGGSPLGVLTVTALFCASGATLSVLFGNLARSRGQAVGFGVLGGNILSALGGCWWPLEVTPVAMQRIGHALPTGWAMHALHRLMSFGDGLPSVLPALGALVGVTLLFLILAVRTFRYQ